MQLDMRDARSDESTLVLVGGSGGMSERYREVAEARGLSLRHFENRVPPGVRRTLGHVVAVIVVVGMVSHALRDQVRNLAPEGAKVLYVRTGSVSALRAAVEEITSAPRAQGRAATAR
jgi:broad specificity phosphatase PhoE